MTYSCLEMVGKDPENMLYHRECYFKRILDRFNQGYELKLSLKDITFSWVLNNLSKAFLDCEEINLAYGFANQTINLNPRNGNYYLNRAGIKLGMITQAIEGDLEDGYNSKNDLILLIDDIYRTLEFELEDDELIIAYSLRALAFKDLIGLEKDIDRVSMFYRLSKLDYETLFGFDLDEDDRNEFEENFNELKQKCEWLEQEHKGYNFKELYSYLLTALCSFSSVLKNCFFTATKEDVNEKKYYDDLLG